MCPLSLSDLVGELGNVVGEEHVACSDIDRLAYSQLGGAGGDFIGGKPDVIVMPGCTEEISYIMQIATRTKTPVVPRGIGSLFTGTNVAKQGGIVIDLARMNRILEVNEDNMVVVAEGGASVYEVMRRCDERDLRFPQQPQYTSGPTMGAAVACNISGARVGRYGRIGEHCVGLEVVLPDGQVVTLGSAAYANTMGHYHRYMGTPDVLGLFVNSGGILGVITKVAVRLDHRYQFTQEISYGWTRGEAKQMSLALYWLLRYRACGVTLVNRWNYVSALERKRVEMPDDTHFVANISVDGHSKEEYDIVERRFRNICVENGGVDLGGLAQFAEGAPRYHHWRGGAVWIGREFTLFVYSTIPTFPQVYDVYEETCRKHDLWSARYIPTWFTYFEQNVGYHFPLLAETFPENPHEMEKLRKWWEEIHVRYTKMGCVQYLIGDVHPRMVAEQLGSAYEFVKRIKKEIDPHNIMNPGHIWR